MMKKWDYTVRALERALRLLQRLDAPGVVQHGFALTELAQAANITPGTACRLLRTLMRYDYVRQDEKHRYYLGRAARVLGTGDQAAERLRRLAEPAVRRLQEATGETVVLAMFQAGMRRTVLTAESRRELRAAAEEGADRRLFDTATGRVLLSMLGEEEADRLRLELDPTGVLWPDCPDAHAFHRRLAEIRQRGYAVCRRPGSAVAAIAAPIRAESAPAPAALGVYYPVFRTPLDSEESCMRLVKQAAAEIAMLLNGGGGKDAPEAGQPPVRNEIEGQAYHVSLRDDADTSASVGSEGVESDTWLPSPSEDADSGVGHDEEPARK